MSAGEDAAPELVAPTTEARDDLEECPPAPQPRGEPASRADVVDGRFAYERDEDGGLDFEQRVADLDAAEGEFDDAIALADCGLAETLVDRICDLAERICDAQGAGDDRCEDGRDRCTRSRARYEDRCALQKR